MGDDKDVKQDVWVGFDLGGTKMLAVILDENLKPLGRKRRKTRGHEGIEAGFERIEETIEKAFKDADVDPARLRGIGIGCPGILDLKKGIINEAPNLGWENAAICSYLNKKFDVPVVLLNDVDAGLYGEFQFGAAKDAHNALGIFPGTGIGGAFIYEGCGRRGCLEAVASRLAISAAIAQAAYRGQAPYVRELAGTDMSDIRSGLIADAVEKDKVVKQIVQDAAYQIGLAAGSMIHLLAPDKIVLGGGLAEALPDLFKKGVNNGIEDWIMPSFKGSYEVEVAKLGDDSTVLGAAAYARTYFQNEKSPEKAVVAS